MSEVNALIDFIISIIGPMEVIRIINKAQEMRRYQCPNCKNIVLKGTVPCPNCKTPLRWF
jgi:hypothetical protein